MRDISDELGLVPTERLMDELKRRYDKGVFAWQNDVDGKDEEIGGSFWGGKATALGLADYLYIVCQNEIMEMCDKEEDGE